MKETLLYVALLFLLDKALLRPSSIENKIKDVFLSYVGGAEEIKVDVELAPFPRDLLGRIEKAEVEMRGFKTETLPITITPKKVMAGKISMLRFEGSDIRYKDIPIKSVSLNLSDLKFNLPRLLVHRKMQFIGAGKGKVSLVLEEEAINEVMKGKANIQLLKDKIKVSLNVGYPPIAIPIEIYGKLEGRGDKIYFVQPTGEILLLPIPQSLLQLAVDRLNPVLDISTLIPFTIPVKIEDIVVEEGEISVFCEVDLSKFGK
ncbi:DUF2993 domain-containing protein [bacterium]|nr:DUF2993 domain-containing protein [bacterium]